MSIGSINTVIVKINNCCNNLDFIEARRLIEFNTTKLSESTYYKLLCTDAKVLIKHVLKSQENQTDKPLTRVERLVLQKIDQYCRKFDITSLRVTLKNYLYLVQREDAKLLLSNDAKGVLQSMGAILGLGSNTSVNKQ